ncbi:MAG TPA: hypothetical protein VGL51_14155 [Solirubrobacteraceae bacterium]
MRGLRRHRASPALVFEAQRTAVGMWRLWLSRVAEDVLGEAQ